MNCINGFAILYCFIFLLSCQLSPEPFKEGAQLYRKNCLSCHGDRLQGLGQLYPSLTDELKLKTLRKDMPCLIQYGRLNSLDSSNKNLIQNIMPSFRHLDAVEITNLLNYLNHYSWKGHEFQLKDIERQLKDCLDASKMKSSYQ